MHSVLLSVYDVSLFQVQAATFSLKLAQSSLRLAPTMPCIHLVVYREPAVVSLPDYSAPDYLPRRVG